MPVVKGYARKSKATRYAGGYLLGYDSYFIYLCKKMNNFVFVIILKLS